MVSENILAINATTGDNHKKFIGRMKQLCVLCSILLLTACTTPMGLTPTPPGDQPGLNAATRSLLEQAEQASARNQLGKASELIERAIRISPRSPYPYEALAQLRYKEGRYPAVRPLLQKAEQLARAIPDSREKKKLISNLNALNRRLDTRQ